MPILRVSLDSTAPTAAPDGTFTTIVSVSEDAYLAGEHLRVASRRATIIGFGGPHRVREVQRLDLVPIIPPAPEIGARAPASPTGSACRPRRRVGIQ